MILRDVLRALPSGAPVAAGTEVKIYREADDALLGTVVTDADGVFAFSANGNPGPVRYEAVVGSSTKIHSTHGIMPVASLDLSGLRGVLASFQAGVVYGYGGDLEVVADGVSLDVAVDSGVALARGVIHRQETPQVFALATAASNPRIDTIAVRFYLAESGADTGRTELVRLVGAEAVTPVAPTLTNTASVIEVPLADIRVDVGVLGIASDKVTDRRAITMPLVPNKAITKAMLADDVAFGVPYVKDGHTNVVVTNATRLNFKDGIKVGVHATEATQAEIDLDFATAAADAAGTSLQPARADHSHNKAVLGQGQITPRVISGNLDDQENWGIPLPAVKCICKVRAYLRVASMTGGPVNGLFWAKLAGQTGAKSSFQSDGGVDSLLVAIHSYETSGGTSLNVAWGISLDGPVNSTGGWLEWECIPIR